MVQSQSVMAIPNSAEGPFFSTGVGYSLSYQFGKCAALNANEFPMESALGYFASIRLR